MRNCQMMTRPPPRVALSDAAQGLGMTSYGLLKLLARVGWAVRDDGRWYVTAAKLRRVHRARRDLGLAERRPAPGPVLRGPNDLARQPDPDARGSGRSMEMLILPHSPDD